MSQQFRQQVGGVTFFFSFDPDDETMLHIFARHTKTAEDAIRAWFGGMPEWNEQHSRYNGVEVTWFWINEARRLVQVISCYSAS